MTRMFDPCRPCCGPCEPPLGVCVEVFDPETDDPKTANLTITISEYKNFWGELIHGASTEEVTASEWCNENVSPKATRVRAEVSRDKEWYGKTYTRICDGATGPRHECTTAEWRIGLCDPHFVCFEASSSAGTFPAIPEVMMTNDNFFNSVSCFSSCSKQTWHGWTDGVPVWAFGDVQPWACGSNFGTKLMAKLQTTDVQDGECGTDLVYSAQGCSNDLGECQQPTLCSGHTNWPCHMVEGGCPEWVRCWDTCEPPCEFCGHSYNPETFKWLYDTPESMTLTIGNPSLSGLSFCYLRALSGVSFNMSRLDPSGSSYASEWQFIGKWGCCDPLAQRNACYASGWYEYSSVSNPGGIAYKPSCGCCTPDHCNCAWCATTKPYIDENGIQQFITSYHGVGIDALRSHETWPYQKCEYIAWARARSNICGQTASINYIGFRIDNSCREKKIQESDTADCRPESLTYGDCSCHCNNDDYCVQNTDGNVSRLCGGFAHAQVVPEVEIGPDGIPYIMTCGPYSSVGCNNCPMESVGGIVLGGFNCGQGITVAPNPDDYDCSKCVVNLNSVITSEGHISVPSIGTLTRC